ncbi:hypothetical protein [Marimonas lutisalis]|uniref:hypothetical protein n=1 Tax=Marimonas lutisalis TaxID=2545756 RepID=UPI0010F94971|nr:hypothetical protein [Marimonas lutisalis]
MSFVRPEARAALWRWREVLLGAVITALGANWALAAQGILSWVGWPVLVIGLGLLIAGLQRARVRPRSGGAGVVDLDEAELRYFLPEGGVVIPLSTIRRIEIDAQGDTAEGEFFWEFTDADGRRARIPASAVGAEKLLDALAQFPGAQYREVAAASAARVPQKFVIWQHDVARLH